MIRVFQGGEPARTELRRTAHLLGSSGHGMAKMGPNVILHSPAVCLHRWFDSFQRRVGEIRVLQGGEPARTELRQTAHLLGSSGHGVAKMGPAVILHSPEVCLHRWFDSFQPRVGVIRVLQGVEPARTELRRTAHLLSSSGHGVAKMGPAVILHSPSV